MAERSKAHAWKACVGKSTGGSNPFPSAKPPHVGGFFYGYIRKIGKNCRNTLDILEGMWCNINMELNNETEKLLTPGDHIVLVPNENASQRTKNRLREHGAHGFLVRQGPRRSVLFPGKVIALFESLTKSAAGRRTWMGWINIEEFDVVEADFGES